MGVVIEVAIGLVLMYLVLSLVVSAANEFLAGVTDRRADFLRKGIENLLGKAMTAELYQHGLIRSLVRRKARSHRSPSYVASGTFSRALMDVLGNLSMPAGEAVAAAAADETAKFQARLNGLSSSHQSIPDLNIAQISADDVVALGDMKEALTVFAEEAGTLGEIRDRIEAWFDEAMDRVSGWYKRRTRSILLILGALLVGWLNADTVAVARQLWVDPSVRSAAVAAATEAIPAQTPEPGETPDPGTEARAAADEGSLQADKPAEAAQTAAEAIQDLDEIGVPLGWATDSRPKDFSGWVWKVLGLLLTTLAIGFGAAFWFDLLKRLVGLRASGPPPSEVSNGRRGRP